MGIEKQKIDIAFVVLHYNNLDDTIECVKSINDNIDTNNYIILVFDNCSPNGSGAYLKDKLSNCQNVKLFLSDKNLGFGAGNNKGIELIREKYEPEYIVLSNNDIVFLEKQFYKKISDEFSKVHFAQLGPMIITADGKITSNPIFDRPFTRYDVEYALRQSTRKLRALKSHTYWLYRRVRAVAFRLFPILRKKKPGPRKYIYDGDFLNRRENAILHGCFMIFSGEFFKYYNGIDVRNFMYAEEDIIYAQIMSKGMKTVYAPNILVYHKEGRSVSNTYGKDRKKEIFLLERYIEAEKGYLSLLDDLEKEGFRFEENK